MLTLKASDGFRVVLVISNMTAEGVRQSFIRLFLDLKSKNFSVRMVELPDQSGSILQSSVTYRDSSVEFAIGATYQITADGSNSIRLHVRLEAGVLHLLKREPKKPEFLEHLTRQFSRLFRSVLGDMHGDSTFAALREVYLLLTAADEIYGQVSSRLLVPTPRGLSAKSESSKSQNTDTHALEMSINSLKEIAFKNNLTVNAKSGVATFTEVLDGESGKTNGYMLWDTKSRKWIHRRKHAADNKPANGKFDFVIFEFAPQQVELGSGHHTVSGGGRPVMYAGEVVMKEGDVVSWNNRSGHFIPHPGYAYQAPFPIGLFYPAHVSAALEKAATIRKNQASSRESDEKQEYATSLFAELVFRKYNKNLRALMLDNNFDIKTIMISKEDNEEIVALCRVQWHLSKSAVINQLLAWGLLRR